MEMQSEIFLLDSAHMKAYWHGKNAGCVAKFVQRQIDLPILMMQTFVALLALQLQQLLAYNALWRFSALQCLII
jgi:hypothetical protein